MGARATVLKECEEEAGIPVGLASRAVACGAVGTRGADDQGRVTRDVLFCFDLELPASFVPAPVDGEAEGFELLDLDAVVSLLRATADAGGSGSGSNSTSGGGCSGGTVPFKPNVALVVVDFLVRRGLVSPDAPGYLPLVASLRPPL